ncbi:hypothetical protein [Absidia glauca]|uniref:G-protein coupled receptors family 1 profile domain-containing protein n=1 Tax=Absidia glauca TaxID=4829 RepID=A0A168NZP7_ABSGL|nr:hypothetical protein [Absidia glauca]
MNNSRPYHGDTGIADEFIPLRMVVIVFTSASLFCSLCTGMVYIFLCFNNYKNAQRPTLQFVMLATVSTVIVETLDIVNWALIGNSRYCGISRTFLLFFNAVNASSLSCIGLNLIFLLYSGVATQNKVKYFYYPGIFLVSLIATSVPIYQACHWYSQAARDIQYNRSCWFYSRHYDGSGEWNFFWLWYFCVLFVIIIVAGVSSILAVCKLFLEYQKQDTSISSKKVFLRVGIRCVLYTLVPFIVNIWSFIMQFTEFHAYEYNYPLVFIDAFLSSCCGILVSAIFFSEPTVITFLMGKCFRRHSSSHTIDDLPYSTEDHSTAVPVI